MPLIWVRGAGELGSAVALTLFRVGYQIILTERAEPLAIRRPVTFSDAVFNGESSVEEVVAVCCDHSNVLTVLGSGKIPLIVTKATPETDLPILAIVDARMLKDSSVPKMGEIPWSIGLGPGFEVGRNCDAIIETQRGHDLGRVLWTGQAAVNSGVPGNIGGVSKQRVIYSPAIGQVSWQVTFGEMVTAGTILGIFNGEMEIIAPISGMVRGLISPQVTIPEKIKIADIDPRGTEVDYRRISEKARNVARGVLEVLLVLKNVQA